MSSSILSHFEDEQAVYRSIEQVHHEELWRAIDRQGGINTASTTDAGEKQFDFDGEFMKYIQWAQAEIQVALSIVDRLVEGQRGDTTPSQSRLTLVMTEPSKEKDEQRSLIDRVAAVKDGHLTTKNPLSIIKEDQEVSSHADRLLALARLIRETNQAEQRCSQSYLGPLRDLGWPVLQITRGSWMVDYDPLRLLYNRRSIGRREVGMAEIFLADEGGRLEFPKETITWLTVRYPEGLVVQVSPELAQRAAAAVDPSSVAAEFLFEWNRQLLVHQYGLMLIEASKSRLGQVILEQSEAFQFVPSHDSLRPIRFSLEPALPPSSDASLIRRALLDLLSRFDASRGECSGFDDAIKTIISDWSNN